MDRTVLNLSLTIDAIKYGHPGIKAGMLTIAPVFFNCFHAVSRFCAAEGGGEEVNRTDVTLCVCTGCLCMIRPRKGTTNAKLNASLATGMTHRQTANN